MFRSSIHISYVFTLSHFYTFIYLLLKLKSKYDLQIKKIELALKSEE